jgi:hypothetical protein
MATERDQAAVNAEAEDSQSPMDSKKVDEKMVAQITEQVRAQIEEQFRSQLDGLNRRVTQEQKEKADLTERLREREESGKTVQEQVAALRAEMQEKERVAAMREKRAAWKAEAIKRSLPEDIAEAFDGSLDMETGVKALERLAVAQGDIVNQRVNEKLSGAPKPGAGNTNDEARKRSEDMSFEELVKAEEKRLRDTEREYAQPVPGL